MVAVLCGCVLLACTSVAQAEKQWDGTKWIDVQPAVPGTPSGDMAALRTLVETKRNDEAVHTAEVFLGRHPNSPLCEEAINLAGIATMQKGRYWDAYHWFERQIEDFPNGPLLSRALDREYQIGEAFLQGRTRRVMTVLKLSAEDEGIEILDRIIEHAPASFIARKSLLRVAKYHFDYAEYEDAILRYDEFVERYPRSAKRASSMIQAARASLLQFRGVSWDTDPLHEAAARYRVIQSAYPQAAKVEGISAILTEIRATLAHKVYHMALFYERTKKPRAAAYYYCMVVRDYRTTRWAGDAKTRLGVLGNIVPLKPSLLPKDFKPITAPRPFAPVDPAMPTTAPKPAKPAKPAVDRTKPIPMRDLVKELRKSRETTAPKD